MHLVFLIHGLFGNPGHLETMERCITDTFAENKDAIVVHRARAMSVIGTFDGIESNALKLLDELVAAMREAKATHLSIVGYSMGGLCGRYLVGLLEEAGAFSNITPVMFATFATPHLGSEYPKSGWFGTLFDLVGSRVAGASGTDLFCRSTVIDDMASKDSIYYRGLSRFAFLCLFANAFKDLTVPFWTSYLSPKDPFSKRYAVDLHLPSKIPMFVDMKNSRVDIARLNSGRKRSWRRMASKLLLQLLIPILLVILTSIMSIISMISFVKRHLPVSFQPRSNPGKKTVGKVGGALDETFSAMSTMRDSTPQKPTYSKSRSGSSSELYDEYQNGGTVVARNTNTTLPPIGLRSPGFEGIIDSAPENLNLSPSILRNMDSLNRLPWEKYSVNLNSLSTHGEIIDRHGRSSDGKEILTVFAEILAGKHREICR